jgi:EAL domain-containing protein (putative c-di-GMP-specific phosphodiesterase class I)
VLQQAGCDMVQGYYYAKPMPSAEFIRYVENAGR